MTSIAYIFLFGRNGLITYRWLLISWDVYSWKSVLVLQTVDQTTTAFLLSLAALRTIDPALEEAAGSLGAKPWRVLRTITLALASPLGVAAFLLNFMHSMSDFGTPLVVGGPFDTLASASYTQLIGRYDPSTASALNVILLAFCLLAYAGYGRLESRFGRDRVMDQSRPVARLDLGWPGRAVWLVCLLFSLFMLALLGAVLLAAFTRNAGGGIAPTLTYFQAVFTRGFAQRPQHPGLLPGRGRCIRPGRAGPGLPDQAGAHPGRAGAGCPGHPAVCWCRAPSSAWAMPWPSTNRRSS